LSIILQSSSYRSLLLLGTADKNIGKENILFVLAEGKKIEHNFQKYINSKCNLN
jgi:hypothetical protein